MIRGYKTSCTKIPLQFGYTLYDDIYYFFNSRGGKCLYCKHLMSCVVGWASAYIKCTECGYYLKFAESDFHEDTQLRLTTVSYHGIPTNQYREKGIRQKFDLQNALNRINRMDIHLRVQGRVASAYF